MSERSLFDLAPGEVVVLDGGLATELERRGNDLSGRLWSARIVLDDPAEVVATHLAYYRAGARVATTASYQLSADGLGDPTLARTALQRTVDLAAQARDQALDEGVRGPLHIAASVGPYGAMLADGSEYHGDYGVSAARLREFHAPRLEVLAGSGADALALETVPSVAEAEVLVELLSTMDGASPAWLSYSCSDSRWTRRGEPVNEAFAVARGARGMAAVGVNCTAPRHVSALVAAAAGSTGLPVVAYPNSGEEWDAVRRQWTGDAGFSPAVVEEWAGAGARLVGGCCRVGPGDITAIAGGLDGADGTPRRD